jgi:bacterioferritin
MQGNQKIIDQLNGLLAHELTSVDLYLIQSRMFDDWGYGKLFEHISGESDHERLHVDALIKRILFLGGMPNLAARSALKVGTTVPEMLQAGVDYETENASKLRTAIAICEAEKDFQTRSTLEPLLKDTEEDHLYWLQKQLSLINKIGLENYLQSQI